MNTEWQKIKGEILNSPKWLVSLDSNDVETIAEGGDCNLIVLEANTEEYSDDRFCLLKTDISNRFKALNLEKCKILRLLIFVQFPISFPIMMAEMNSINELIDDIASDEMDCEIKWGLSPREDNISRIVCAFNSFL